MLYLSDSDSISTLTTATSTCTRPRIIMKNNPKAMQLVSILAYVLLIINTIMIGQVLYSVDSSYFESSRILGLALNSEEFKISTDIPLFLNIDGGGSEFISKALSNCCNLTQKTILFMQDKNIINEEQHPDFIFTNSLCNLTQHLDLKQNQKIHVFMLVRNPLVQTLLSFIAKRDRSNIHFNQRIARLDFKKYLNSNFLENNQLTRSLLCKSREYTLTDDDYTEAKYILSNFINFRTFGEYQLAINSFYAKYFSTSYSANEIEECKKKSIMEDLRKQDRLFKKFQVEEKLVDFSEDLKQMNKYDTKLYQHALFLSSIYGTTTEVNRNMR